MLRSVCSASARTCSPSSGIQSLHASTNVNHQKARGVSAPDTVETWDVPKGVIAREAAGPAVRKRCFVVLRLLVERSHLICVIPLAFPLGEAHSSMEGESDVLQGEKC
jgi:hypothetical protein